MKKFFTTDIPIKLVSLGMSVLLWVYLVVLLNPQIEASYSNVPINFKGHTALTQNGYVITNEPSKSLSLKLKGSRNMLANVNKNNIYASVDLSGCTEAKSYTLPVHTDLPYDELSVIDKSPYSVTVVVDKVISKEFPVTIVQKGEVKEKYHIDTITPEVEAVTLKGPSEMIKNVGSVVVNVDIDGVHNDFENNIDVSVLDIDGNVLNSSLLTLSHQKLKVSVSVLNEKTVPLNTSYVLIPEGYELSSVTPSEITIMGKKEALDLVTEIKTERYEFTEALLKAEVPLIIPEDIKTDNQKTEIVINLKENVESDNENDNQ